MEDLILVQCLESLGDISHNGSELDRGYRMGFEKIRQGSVSCILLDLKPPVCPVMKPVLEDPDKVAGMVTGDLINLLKNLAFRFDPHAVVFKDVIPAVPDHKPDISLSPGCRKLPDEPVILMAHGGDLRIDDISRRRRLRSLPIKLRGPDPLQVRDVIRLLSHGL